MVERRPLVLIHLLIALILMVLTTFLPSATPTANHHHCHHHYDRHSDNQQKRSKKKKPSLPTPQTPAPKQPSSVSSWEHFMTLLSCKSTAEQVHDPSTTAAGKLGRAACGSSICAIRDVVHGNTRVVHRADTDIFSVSDNGSFSQLETAPLTRSSCRSSSSSRRLQQVHVSGCRSYDSRGGGGMPLRKFSGCSEYHAVSVEPVSRRYPSQRTLCACSECGEVFTKSESLELHQAIRHAVSELGLEDAGRNIVEIIFKSSWQQRDRPICMIERILKVHNTSSTVLRFEDYRSAVKARALPHSLPSAGTVVTSTAHSGRHHQQKKNPRCAADGNELLRFHCTTLSCSLGDHGSTFLCCDNSSGGGANTNCGVCYIIRHGFSRPENLYGVRTTASSGRAHDCGPKPLAERGGGGKRRAMLVCRVIAGRIRRPGDDPSSEEGYDSVAGEGGGQYGNFEELFVSNPRAILPCFVVIYRAMD